MGTFYSVSTLAMLGLGGCEKPTPQTKLQPLLGNWVDFDKQLMGVGDPRQRDLVLLQLAVENPRFSSQLCKRSQSQGAKEKCRQVLGRPHLRTAQ